MKKKLIMVLLSCSLAMTAVSGCGNKIDSDAVVATLDGQEITLGLANFIAQLSSVTYDAYLGSYYGNSMWDLDMSGDGSTMTQTVQNSTMEELETDYLLEAHMSDYGVEITDEDMTNIETAAAKFMEDNSKETIRTMGATEEYVKEALRLYLIQQRTYDAIIADADTEVSDEEAAQKTFSYYYIKLSDEDTTDDEEADAKALEELAAEVAEAAQTDFDGVADTYGLTMNSHSFGSQEDSFAEEVLEAADALEEGEVSELITTEGGANYVIRLDSAFDEEATESRKSEIVSERQSDLYTEIVDGYKEAASWEVDEELLTQIAFGHGYNIVTDEEEAATENE